jgi:FkbM family methyltransferase
MDTRRALTALRHIRRAPEVLRCMQRLEHWRTIAPAYVGIRPIPFPFTTRTRSGVVFELEEFYDVETLWQIYCRGVYLVEPQDRIIIDAGANIGLFACYATTCAPHAVVHAVEPFPQTFERLVRTVRENGLEDRVACHNVALSSVAGLSTMSAAAPASQMFHLVHSPREAAAAIGVSVRTTTLSALLDTIDAPRIDLLKMDIEGSEYDVLLGTRIDVLRRIRRVSVEFHKPGSVDGGDKQALARHLCSAGFRLRQDADATGEYGIFHFSQ